MIRVLIVDDDARVAHNHRELVESLTGFTVVDVAHTAAAALAGVERDRPDLVLLDLYLPDDSGISVLRALRAQAGPATADPVDVLVITAVRDIEQVRAALHGGAVHYLLKPFPLTALRDQLERYAAARRRLTRVEEATQSDVDRLFGLMRPVSPQSLPKGLTPATAELVADTLRAAESDLSAAEVGERTGVARVTARRYLEHLCADGRAELRMRYGSTGRPEHRYRWVR
ncbi:two-component system CitB family response regulator [Spinactinospora alkalitolerans]|uniref:Transcriptional regulatory protein n=1 Tax=Spinactinospora alkalitolerans TaxID=687207 RepID=A0A852U0Q9_9ACTN|nr:response regulator [Spinactinospora alkalitolerans]NYE48922.1 two-component system CitB family response regulator [Spinactinospora alkalitolerans]